MKRILIFLFGICFFVCVKADIPGIAYQYDRYSEDGKYYFKSIPYCDFEDTNFGKTKVYDATTNTELYSIETYLPSQAFIGNEGKTILSTTYWLTKSSDFDNQVLVRVFIEGKITVNYYLKDLITRKSALKYTSSHALWYSKMIVKNDILYIETVEQKIVQIDLKSGKILIKKKISKIKNWYEITQNPNPLTNIYYDIQYPKYYEFPDLENGKTFRESLLEHFQKKSVHTYEESTYYTMIYGIIDKNGTCEIYDLHTNHLKKKDTVWEQNVRNWIVSQHYKTDLIPENCEKWIFREFFYVKDI